MDLPLDIVAHLHIAHKVSPFCPYHPSTSNKADKDVHSTLNKYINTHIPDIMCDESIRSSSSRVACADGRDADVEREACNTLNKSEKVSHGRSETRIHSITD